MPLQQFDESAPQIIEEISDDDEPITQTINNNRRGNSGRLLSRLDFDDNDFFAPAPQPVMLNPNPAVVKEEVAVSGESLGENVSHFQPLQAPLVNIFPQNSSMSSFPANNEQQQLPVNQFLQNTGISSVSNSTLLVMNSRNPQQNGLMGSSNPFLSWHFPGIPPFNPMLPFPNSLPMSTPLGPIGITRDRIEEMLEWASRLGPGIEQNRNLIILLTAFKNPHNYSSEAKLKELLEYCVTFFYNNYNILRNPRNGSREIGDTARNLSNRRADLSSQEQQHHNVTREQALHFNGLFAN